MNPLRRQRLFLVIFILLGVGVAVALTLTALQENINLFYSPKQILAGEAPTDRPIRAGGMVVAGSVKRDPNSLKVAFEVTDYSGTIAVDYEGILPDLFKEGQGIVALGRWAPSGRFVATEVLAKHDENYMPPEVAAALKANPPKPK